MLLLGWVRWPACAQDWDADARAFSFPIRSFLVNSRGSGSRRVGGSSGASGAEGDALATVLRCRRAFVVKGRSGAARVWRIGVRQGGSTARGGRFSAVVLVDLPLSPPSPSPALPPPPPSPPLPRRRALREGQRRRRACALELERSGRSAAPGTPPSLAPSSSALPWRRRWRTPARRGDGGTGQIRRPRARPVAAAAGSGGLDVLLGRWRHPPRAPSRPFLARPPPPLLPGRRPWRVPARGHGGEQIPGKRRGGAAAAAPPGAAARPQDHGDEAEAARAEGEGLRVNFPLVEGFFCKKPRNCTISAVRAPDRTAGKSGRRGHARC